MSPSRSSNGYNSNNSNEITQTGELFNLQVAGHGDILRTPTGHLLKPSSEKERAFYDVLAVAPTAHLWLRPFLPRYFGTTFLAHKDNNKAFLKLQDLTIDLARPCVLDIKLGDRQWDNDASAAKIKKLRARAAVTTSALCGIRFAGMRRETPDGRVATSGRDTATALTELDLLPALRWFLHDGRKVRVSLARKAACAIREFIALVEKQTDFLFYGTSLLVLYDGAAVENLDHSATKVDIKFIDFAHTINANGETDDNTLFGLHYLLRLFDQVIEADGNAYLPDLER